MRHYFFKCFCVGLRVRTAIVVAVYRKALVLAASEKQVRTAGEITNLIAVDAARLQNLTTFLHAIWYSPLQIGLAIFFLWQQLGPSCLGGVVVIIIMMPVTKAVAKFMGEMQKKLMTAKDERVEVNNEVLGSMKVIKFQAWEQSFADKIMDLRNKELDQLFKYIIANSFTIMLWSSVPLLVSLATFGAYVWLGNNLDVASALTALALFEIIRFPLFMLPQVINSLVEASVSVNRVRSFLLCDEYTPVSEGELSNVGINISGASFVYDSKRPNDTLVSSGNDSADPVKENKISDSEWEIMLLKSQLADAENEIKHVLKGRLEIKEEEMNNDDAKLNNLTGPLTSEANLLSLRRVGFETGRGELIAVVGAVGSGKTTFINSILGEVRALNGSVSRKGRVAYFAQSPFIMNDTLKGNVLFGRQEESFDEERYKTAISVCALKHDLELLPHGDMCEIGEKGITLSGGQKARVAMARVVYHDADICLLDDPLAAVDAHVGRYLFQNCIVNKLLFDQSKTQNSKQNVKKEKKRCVILVTNALQYLSNPVVDRILVLNDGCVKEQGTYKDLTSDKSSLFSSFLQSFQGSLSGYDENAESTIDSGKRLSVPSLSATSLCALADVPDNPEVSCVVSPKPKPDKVVFQRRLSNMSESRRRSSMSDASRQAPDDTEAESKAPASTLMTDELLEREIGHVNSEVYIAWAKAAGGTWVGIAIITFFAAVESINVCSRWWLTHWSTHGSEGRQVYFLAVYAAINLSSVVASFFRIVFIMMSGLRASRQIFSDLLDGILRAPMSFFDTTPIGRIVNRFSKDMYAVDEELVVTFRGYLATLVTVIGVVVVIASATPLFVVCLVPVTIYYIKKQNYFTKTYRELKRLDSILRSPVYALLSETLDGVHSIRAFASQNALFQRMCKILDIQQNAYFLTFTAQCWLSVITELAGTLIITFACLCSVFQHSYRGGDEEYASIAGLAVSFSLSVTVSLNWMVRLGSDLQANMVSVERIHQYSNQPSEAPTVCEMDSEVNPMWPTNGEVVFKGVKMRYRPRLPLVLKGLDIIIPAQSKVGVVGRTGAGKSSLMVVLLRIVELDSGYILIDGINISHIGLAMLRKKVAVIPQDPVLFAGTIRTNLDPFDKYDDQRLYEVLQRVGLMEKLGKGDLSLGNASGVKSLSDKVFEGGENLSVGQKQLLVIARALLQDARIVIMDEATAAVDAETDSRIQRVMRTEFKNATCITVAHRLNTIMDSDLILVMDDGMVAEFDCPTTLMDKGGMFKDLVDTWEEEHCD